MESVIKSAKTVDEAVSLALSELEVSRDCVEIEIIEEPSKGLFGLLGVKPAIVRVAVSKQPQELAITFLQELCGRLSDGISVAVDHENENELVIGVEGDNLGLIIGKRGETLNALQYLTTLVYNKRLKSYKRVLINAGNYRENRENTLSSLATRLADRVRRTGRSVHLEPMNAYERRIIHTALQDFAGVYTYSEGTEPERKVVIASKQ